MFKSLVNWADSHFLPDYHAIEEDELAANLMILKHRMLIFFGVCLFFISLMIVVVNYVSVGWKYNLLTQIISLGVITVILVYSYFFKNYNIIAWSFLVMGTFHLPIRHFAFHTFVAPTAIWYVVIPSISIFFLNIKYAIPILGLYIFIPTSVFCCLFFLPTTKVAEATTVEIIMYINVLVLTIIFTSFIIMFEKLRLKWKNKLSSQYKELNQATKLATIGELAGNVAHEINNPLSIISASNQVIKKELEKNELNKEKLISLSTKISSTVHRITNISQTLLSLARTDSEEKMNAVTTFKEVIDSVLTLCEYKLRDQEIVLKVEEEHLQEKIFLSHNGLTQVILNLVINATDAIPDNHDEKWIVIKILNNENEFVILVIDSGTGIPIETREKIMAPFFTTKKVGKGTGLGLSISNKILHQFDARLELCDKNIHTCFKIYIKKSLPDS